MTAPGLVLSIFPGIDLLGRAFEEGGFCVVRGPDLLWGGDIRTFHPPAGVFDGVIGGPPCQAFSALRHLIRHNGHEPRFGNLIPEFERVVAEAGPTWFLMENVPDAPIPDVPGLKTWACMVRDKWVGGVQPRPRRFSFGTQDGTPLDIEWVALMQPTDETRSVTADSRIGSTGTRVRGGGGVLPHGQGKERLFAGGNLPGMGSPTPIDAACEAMGLPRDFTEHMPFTMHGKRSAIGNAVPMPMGRAVAKAVKRALGAS